MIKVYSKHGCPHCDVAKLLLTSHGYTYEEVRIDEVQSAKEFVLSNGHKTVPQIYLGETLLVEGGAAGLKKMTTKQLAIKIREINGN